MTFQSPSPWTYEVHELSSGYSAIVYDANGTRVGTDHLTEEDARLIAAAPDYDEAARCYVAWVEVFKQHQIAPNVLSAMENAFGAKLRAAIAKAETQS